MAKFKTEDEVRTEAGQILGLCNSEGCVAGVGQLTTFNKLGFKGVVDKPDGWFFPESRNEPAIILEAKSSDKDLSKKEWVRELQKNVDIAKRRYDKVIGILYNGYDAVVYKDGQKLDLQNQLFAKEYYLKLYDETTIDKNLIYTLTKKINDNLHFNFGIKNLNHRMIFTACALVAKRYGALLHYGMNWDTLNTSVLSTLKRSYQDSRRVNQKLDLIEESYKSIQCNFSENATAIDEFIDSVNAISEHLNSDSWNGEDVMGIFFNEFTRYKGKSEAGQVFTPDHITSLMYRITGTTYKDRVLDACCGSGAFLTKAMANMIREVGGNANEAAVKKIKNEHLFGVEFDKEVFTLACANMLIHKDGKTNLTHDDSRTPAVGQWIRERNITRVLMNPPYEKKYGCMEIVENVLDNVADGAICAFILPDQKLVVEKKKADRILQNHTLQKIIKLPDIFAGMAGTSTSIFIFKAHEKHENKQIFSCWIPDDGFETVKNQGRHDIRKKWPVLEDYWVDVIYKQSGDASVQWLKVTEPLCYKMPEQEFSIDEKDFKKTVLDYILFESQIDEKDFKITISNVKAD
ncbi:MAG: SAM-dependent DNA methyltransferase [Alphaproteobacteria bacterium]|nr:SAM-dependent DNA methyltransferase [Alphaproteobacteria bacterium]